MFSEKGSHPHTFVRALIIMVIILIFTALHSTQGAATWEMRVCTSADDLPASNAKLEGFENRIAQIIADELAARLVYVWSPSDVRMIRDYLRTGACDVVMGVPDGYLGVLSTVPYYQIPHVFIYRKDSSFDVQSLSDEILKRLRISTYPLSLPHQALRNLGLEVTLFHPAQISTQLDVAAPIIRALLNRDVDVAILDGPVGAFYVKQNPELKIKPVSPEIAPPLLPMFQMGTIGVRQGDVALRDRINVALARRWSDIQEVFREYGIPLLPLPRPEVTGLAGTNLKPLRIGVVLPIPTGNPTITDSAGLAARFGAVIAGDLLDGIASDHGLDLQILVASAPNPEAALRAAQRLVATEKVFALIGGLGEGQAKVLSEFAEKESVLFFNIGEPSEALRRSCYRHTFHIEASASMYLDSVIEWFSSKGYGRWFFLYPDSEEGRGLYERALELVRRHQGHEVGHSGIAPGNRIYSDIVDQVRRTAPDIIFSFLAPENQDFLLAQIDSATLTIPLVSFPYPVTQTRTYWMRLRQSTSFAERTYRPALWESTLGEGAARDFNDQFGSRTGNPADPSAWAAYAALKILLESVLSTGSTDATRLVAYLEDPKTSFDLHKGVPLSFRPWDHQLRQPLYIVRLNPEAEIGTRLSQQLALVQLVDRVPEIPPGADPVPLLDRLGDSGQNSSCQR